MYGIDWGTEDVGREDLAARLADDDAFSASGDGDGELAELLLAWLALQVPKASSPPRCYFAMYVLAIRSCSVHDGVACAAGI